MKRVPVDLVLHMLTQSGIQANARQIRNWRLRGHVTRTAEGYDLAEIVAYLDRRNEAAERRQERLCSVPECGRTHSARGFCVKHYRRVVKHGDPHWDPRSGIDIGYDAVHARLRRQLGRAEQHQCVECGRQAADWAYDHADEDEIVDASGRVYSMHMDHYRPMCRCCHKRFDRRFDTPMTAA